MWLELGSLLILLVLVVTVHRQFDLSEWLNPFVLFFLFHVVFLFVGLLYHRLYDHAVEIQPGVFLLVWTGLTCTVLGATVAKHATYATGQWPPKKRKTPFCEDVAAASSVAKGFLLIGAVLATLYFAWIGGVPLVAGDADNFRVEARMGKGFLVLAALAFLKYGAYKTAFVNAVRRKSWFGFTAWVATAFLLAVGIGNRGPALEILVFSILIAFVVRGIRPRLASLLPLALTALVLMALLGILRQGLSVTGLMIYLQVLWRPFANIQNLQWIYEWFPDRIPFLCGGGYLIDLEVLLPGYSANFGTWFKDQAGLVFSGGSVTVSYLGEIFANFGWAGVIPISFGYGFGLASLYVRRLSLRHPDDFMFLVIMTTTLKGVVSSGLVPVLLYDTMILLAVHGCYKACVWIAKAYAPSREGATVARITG
jgi:oligosaccharide repeat unit polymerase